MMKGEAESKPALWSLFEKGTNPIFTLLTSSRPDYLPEYRVSPMKVLVRKRKSKILKGNKRIHR